MCSMLKLMSTILSEGLLNEIINQYKRLRSSFHFTCQFCDCVVVIVIICWRKQNILGDCGLDSECRRAVRNEGNPYPFKIFTSGSSISIIGKHKIGRTNYRVYLKSNASDLIVKRLHTAARSDRLRGKSVISDHLEIKDKLFHETRLSYEP